MWALDTLARIPFFAAARIPLPNVPERAMWIKHHHVETLVQAVACLHVVQSCMKLSDFDGRLFECRSTVLMGFLTNLIYKFYYYYGILSGLLSYERILAHAPTFADFPVFCESLSLLQTTFDVRFSPLPVDLFSLFICILSFGEVFPLPHFRRRSFR